MRNGGDGDATVYRDDDGTVSNFTYYCLATSSLVASDSMGGPVTSSTSHSMNYPGSLAASRYHGACADLPEVLPGF